MALFLHGHRPRRLGVLSVRHCWPAPRLVQALAKAGSPRDWALQQVNAAYAASQQ